MTGPAAPPPAPPALTLDELRRLADAHLGPPLWLAPEHLAWLRDPAASPEPIRSCFTDALYKGTVEPLTHPFPAQLVLQCEGDVRHRVVARLAPELPGATIVMFLTADASLLFLVHADAARRKDGIIQLQDGQASVTALTPAALKAQTGKAILRGDLVHAVAVHPLPAP